MLLAYFRPIFGYIRYERLILSCVVVKLCLIIAKLRVGAVCDCGRCIQVCKELKNSE